MSVTLQKICVPVTVRLDMVLAEKPNAKAKANALAKANSNQDKIRSLCLVICVCSASEGSLLTTPPTFPSASILRLPLLHEETDSHTSRLSRSPKSCFVRMGKHCWGTTRTALPWFSLQTPPHPSHAPLPWPNPSFPPLPPSLPSTLSSKLWHEETVQHFQTKCLNFLVV